MSEQFPYYRDLDPTVVPAQHGFRLVTFGYGRGEKPDKDTKPTDLWTIYQTVIAWIIRPGIKNEFDCSEVDSATVHVVTLNGLGGNDEDYIIDPFGQWSQPYVNSFESELHARQHWIDSHTETT